MKRLLGILGSAGAAAPSYWPDAAYDSRVALSATNGTGVPLHDHVVTATLPVGIDANSLRIVETTTDGAVDDPSSWRYIPAVSFNRTRFLIHALSGQTVTFKVPGKWASAATRTFHAYWNSAGGIAALSVTHLGNNPQGWTYAITVGNTGDVFKLVVAGSHAVTATYTQLAGNTAAVIGAALAAQITTATATVTGTSTLTIKQADYADAAFAVTSTGSTLTGTGAVTITQPNYYGLSRGGPDTETFSATATVAGLPYKNPASGAATRPGWGHSTNRILRLGAWSENGVGSQNISAGTVSALTATGPTLAATGAATGTSPKWTVAYTATYSHKIVSGRKSTIYPDDGTATLAKYVDVWRIQLVYTCAVAYTSSAILNTVTGVSGHDLLTLATTDDVFTSNVTENGVTAGAGQGAGAQTGNACAAFYADKATGTITVYAASANLSALTPEDNIYGFHGNAVGMGFALVSAPVLAGFSPQAPQARVAANGNPFLYLQLRNLTTASQIPQGATVTLDCWFVHGNTANASTVGDNLLPDEIVTLLRGLLATSPAVTVNATTERYASGSVAATAKAASTKLVAGCQWFADNALAHTGLAANTAYARDLVAAQTYGEPDDDDGNYGEAFKLAGLCLRYLRLHEASVLTQIERQVQFHLDIEAAAVSAYGSFWSGTAPYWYWGASVTSTAFAADGGINGGIAPQDVDPTFGVNFGSITYTQGQVRRQTSIDQMHMVGLALYHYLYLLRNESAVTANTTLRANALAYLLRLKTFEAGGAPVHFNAADRTLDNLYAICTSTSPVNSNGVTTGFVNTRAGTAYPQTPYLGQVWYGWQVSNATQSSADASANSALDYAFRGIYAPDTTLAGLKKFTAGRVQDMSMLDLGHHDVTTTGSGWGYASTAVKANGSLPKGWGVRSASSENLKYNAGASGDKHYVEITAANRDAFSGRTPQRLAVVALAALFDPSATVTIENDGSGVAVRTVPITTYVDQLVLACGTHLIDDATGAGRFAASGFLGGATNAGKDGYGTTQNVAKVAQAPFTGYGLFGMELALLVKSNASYASYYSPNGVF